MAYGLAITKPKQQVTPALATRKNDESLTVTLKAVTIVWDMSAKAGKQSERYQRRAKRANVSRTVDVPKSTDKNNLDLLQRTTGDHVFPVFIYVTTTGKGRYQQ